MIYAPQHLCGAKEKPTAVLNKDLSSKPVAASRLAEMTRGCVRQRYDRCPTFVRLSASEVSAIVDAGGFRFAETERR